MALRAVPVTASSPGPNRPSSLAIALAVSTWSPVIMTGRMPAPRQARMASTTSGRTGSIMPVRPRKHRCCSSAAGDVSPGSASYVRMAAASTRRALPVMA